MTDFQTRQVNIMALEVSPRYRAAQARGKADFPLIVREIVKAHGYREWSEIREMCSLVIKRHAQLRKGRTN